MRDVVLPEKSKEKNLTQEQLAAKLGVSNKTISKWETGVSQTKGYYIDLHVFCYIKKIFINTI